jgi:hypothetical protein
MGTNDPLRNRCRAQHDASGHVARIRQQSLVGLGARETIPEATRQLMRQRSGRRRLASGRSRKCAFVRACRETPAVIEVVKLAERVATGGKIKEAAHKCAKPLAGLAFRRAVALL